MLTIEILAKDGTEVAASVTIGKPKPVGNDYACDVKLNDDPERPVFGAGPLDTLKNALTLAEAWASRIKDSSGWRVS